MVVLLQAVRRTFSDSVCLSPMGFLKSCNQSSDATYATCYLGGLAPIAPLYGWLGSALCNTTLMPSYASGGDASVVCPTSSPFLITNFSWLTQMGRSAVGIIVGSASQTSSLTMTQSPSPTLTTSQTSTLTPSASITVTTFQTTSQTPSSTGTQSQSQSLTPSQRGSESQSFTSSSTQTPSQITSPSPSSTSSIGLTLPGVSCIATVAGHTVLNGAPAMTTQLSQPWGIASDAQGGFYFSEPNFQIVRRMWANATVSVVAGVMWAPGNTGMAYFCELSVCVV